MDSTITTTLKKSAGISRMCLNKKPAAAPKSLQSCPTLCDPIDGRPPGSPVPGILQARILEWVAISFSRMRGQTTEISSVLSKWVFWVLKHMNLWRGREKIFFKCIYIYIEYIIILYYKYLFRLGEMFKNEYSLQTLNNSENYYNNMIKSWHFSIILWLHILWLPLHMTIIL